MALCDCNHCLSSSRVPSVASLITGAMHSWPVHPLCLHSCAMSPYLLSGSHPRPTRIRWSSPSYCSRLFIILAVLSLVVLSSHGSPPQPDSQPQPNKPSSHSSHDEPPPPHSATPFSSSPSSASPSSFTEPPSSSSFVASIRPSHTAADNTDDHRAAASARPAADDTQQQAVAYEVQARATQDPLHPVDVDALRAGVEDARQQLRQGLQDERDHNTQPHAASVRGSSHRRLLAGQQHDDRASIVDDDYAVAEAETHTPRWYAERTQTATVDGSEGPFDVEDEAAEKAEHEMQLMVDEFIAQADLLLASSTATAADVSEAMTLLSDAAALGSSHAHIELGKAYLYGDLAPRNVTTAFEHFQQAADSGNSTAQHYLAFLYSLRLVHPPAEASATGLAVLHDYFAAVAGHIGAKLTMGYRHLHGYGVPKSCESAVHYYDEVARHVVNTLSHSAHNHVMTIDRAHLSDEQARLAHMEESAEVLQYYQHSADGGNVDAQLTMGQLHYYGHRGLPQSPALAARYFRLAAAAGNTNAMASLGQMHLSGMMQELDNAGGGGGGGGLFGGVSRRDGLVPYEREDSNSSALNLFTRAAELGNPAAQTSLGLLYLQGTLTSVNYTLAASYFLTAANQGHPEAQFQLGVMHLGGLAFTQDVLKAYMYFQAAAMSGHVRGLFNVAQMDMAGIGVARDCKGGADKLKMVAERGEWSSVLGESHERFLAGEYESSWLGYAMAGYEGQEVGQANAAWLMDRQYVQLWRDEPERYAIAYQLLHQSAEQRNVDSWRLMGDYAYYQLVQSNNSLALAASHYLKATNEAGFEHSAQAAFNLGWMYHSGLGVERDLHLAKRYYDHSADMDERGWVACKLALVKLWLDAAVDDWTQWWHGTTPANPTMAADRSDTPRESGQADARSGVSESNAGQQAKQTAADGVVSRGLRAVFGPESALWGWYDWYVALENCVLVAASAALAVCIYYRAQRM